MSDVIEERFRPDGVACYFFKRDGIVLHSGYDKRAIQLWAYGYTNGEAVQVRRINTPCREGLANAD